MKKSVALVLLCLSFLSVAIILAMLFFDLPGGDTDTLGTTQTTLATTTTTTTTTTVLTTTTTASTTTATQTVDTTSTARLTTTTKKATTTTAYQGSLTMEGALFIGDSRTVGLSEYSGISGADFYADVGMSVYNIHQKNIAISGLGKVALTTLLEKKEYSGVYIMLGINEVGYTMSNTVAKYRELVTLIREKQPDALIFIQANLHVSKSRSNSDKYANNPNLNKLNGLLSQIADGETVHYLDANVLFDDAEGHLASDKAGDGIHLYAKYYKDWGRWIVEQTAQHQ